LNMLQHLIICNIWLYCNIWICCSIWYFVWLACNILLYCKILPFHRKMSIKQKITYQTGMQQSPKKMVFIWRISFQNVHIVTNVYYKWFCEIFLVICCSSNLCSHFLLEDKNRFSIQKLWIQSLFTARMSLLHWHSDVPV
jgi:hypothetical protein